MPGMLLAKSETRQAIVQSCLRACPTAGMCGRGAAATQKIYEHSGYMQHATLEGWTPISRESKGWNKGEKQSANGQHVYVFKEIQFAIIWQANQVEISMRFPPVAGVIIRGYVFGHKSSDLQLFSGLFFGFRFSAPWKIEKWKSDEKATPKCISWHSGTRTRDMVWFVCNKRQWQGSATTAP